MRVCKEKFNEFERREIKYQEDLKYAEKKIKKLEDKLEKVVRNPS